MNTVELTRDNNKFITSVFRKPTFTGLSSNFSSFTPLLYKINLIKTLLFKSYNICSNFLLIHDEFIFIRKFLLHNSYKNNIIERCIKIFLNNKNNGKSLHSYPPKLKLYFKLPFYGDK